MSVVTTVYNGAPYFDRAIPGILGQFMMLALLVIPLTMALSLGRLAAAVGLLGLCTALPQVAV